MGKLIEAPGKAMIGGGTRDICAKLYTTIVALPPDWHSDDLSKGKIKVVYSGDATDAPPVSDHVHRDSLNAQANERLKNVDDELELVIVKDMMLPGYDSPTLHTLYLDRPLKGRLLMQTLARVNRTFPGREPGEGAGGVYQSDCANKPVAASRFPEDSQRLLGNPIAAATSSGEVLDIYDAAACRSRPWTT